MAGMVKFRSVPLLLPTICYCLGIVSGRVFGEIWFWLIFTVTVIIIAAVLPLVYKRNRWVGYLFLLLSFLGFGGFRYVESEYYFQNDHIVRYCQGDGLNIFTVCGEVVDEPVMRERKGKLAQYDFLSKDGMVFNFRCVKVCLPEGDRLVSGLIRVSTNEPALHIKMGDELVITGKVYLRSKQDSVSGNYIRKDRILAGMYIEHNELIKKRASAGNNSWLNDLQAVRDRVSDILLQGRSGSKAGTIYNALLLGERKEISSEIKDDFLRSGTMHYLSLSGLHVAMLTGFLWFALRVVGVPRLLQGLLPLVFVICYMILVPNRPPIFRAGLIMIMFCIAFIMRKSSSGLNLLAFSCLVLLVVKPLNFFDIGFQLSYGVVISLIIISPDFFVRVFEDPTKIKLVERYSLTMLDTRRWHEIWRDRVRQYFLYSIAVSVVAWMVSVPLVCYSFNRISWLAPVNSVILAIPVTAAMAAGVIKVMLGMIMSLGPVSVLLLNAPAELLLFLNRSLASVPMTAENVGELPGWFYLLYLILVLMVLYFAFLRRYLKVKKLICCWILLFVVMVFLVGSNKRVYSMEVHVLPVGHGCCVVCRLPSSRVIMYDCGSYDDFNLVEYRVMPYLRKLGIDRIDALVVSHLDMDHYSGVPDLLSSIGVGKIFMPICYADHFSASDCDYMQMVKKESVEVGLLECGSMISGDNWRVEVLWPESYGYENPNNGSVVARISDSSKSVLFCGDIEPKSIRKLIESGVDLSADYLLLPHHGQYSSELKELISKVRPDTIAVSGRQLDGKRKEQLAGLGYNIQETGSGEVVVLK